jgi:hypothetical protein
MFFVSVISVMTDITDQTMQAVKGKFMRADGR